MRSRRVKTGLGLVALLLPGGLLFLVGWLFLRGLGRAHARARSAAVDPSGAVPMWQVWQLMSRLSFRDVLREARAAL